jgi:glyoxylase-like metal-dependent hydrolase (beta-lactamase superfamily II)
MQQPDVTPFEVYAIRYATVERRVAENYIGSDAHETATRMDYFIWLARNDKHVVVVDTGFDQSAALRRKRQFLRSPADGLKLLGVDPVDVREVILTHLHYDHAGNLDLFPAARFHLQDREMAFATGRYMSQAFFAQAYDLDNILDTVRLVHGRRVLFHDGDGSIVPGISVHRIGGHTRGLQAVRVWTRVGWLVLASDAAHYTANRVEERPFPIVAEVTDMVDGWRKLVELASSPEHVVPGHDPLVMRQYRAPSPALDGIVVRLDDKPCT